MRPTRRDHGAAWFVRIAPASLLQGPGKPDMSPAMRLLGEGGGNETGRRRPATDRPRTRLHRGLPRPVLGSYLKPGIPASAEGQEVEY